MLVSPQLREKFEKYEAFSGEGTRDFYGFLLITWSYLFVSFHDVIFWTVTTEENPVSGGIGDEDYISNDTDGDIDSVSAEIMERCQVKGINLA